MADANRPDQATLIALYGNLIKRTALLLRMRMPWADLDDLLQWGAIGMMEAQQRFDSHHGVEFKHFAMRRIRGAMIDGLRREGSYRRGEMTLEPEAVDIAMYLDNRGPQDPLTLLAMVDDRSLLATALRTLPKLEYQILALHFYDDLNNREIASVLDVSEGYASRLRKRALETLATYITTAQQGEAPKC